MAHILNDILRYKREEISALPTTCAAPSDRRDFAGALASPGLGVIAEIKRRSPSRGAIAPSIDPARIAADYETGGAVAISCLTDATFFGARPDDLPAARNATSLPVLRKDFIIDQRQIHESAAMGADAILLIARVLAPAQLRDLLRTASSLRLAALVETHDEADIDKALDAGATIIGVNNRNLATFEVSLETAVRLRRRIPDVCLSVAESGIHSQNDLHRMRDAGYDAVLVGESLARSSDPAFALQSLLGGALRPTPAETAR